jgi:DNA-binding XRE family transcriptional regulator
MEGKLKVGQNNKLRELRQRQKWPQWAVAVQTRISPATLSAIERWGYKPGVELQERIATALGGNIADIWPEVSHE